MGGTVVMTIPECPSHGIKLQLRPARRQTKEQAWCGTWYDCPRCGYAILLMSRALSEVYRKAGKYVAPPGGHPDVFGGQPLEG